MQTRFLLFILSSLFLISCNESKKQAGNLHLTGNIEGLSQGKLYIQKLKDTSLILMDSISIKGKSTFETYLQIDEPEMLYLFLDRGQTNSIDNNLYLFAEPGKIDLKTNLKEFFAATEIKGSKNHDLYTEFSKMRVQFTDKKMEILEKELKNTNNNQKTNDSIFQANNKLLRKKYLYVANFAITHADKEIAPYLALTEIPDIKISFLDSIQTKLSPKIKNSKYGKLLKKHIEDRKKME